MRLSVGAGSEILHCLYVIRNSYKFRPKLVRVSANLVAERRVAAEVEDDVFVIGDVFCLCSDQALNNKIKLCEKTYFVY